MQGPGTGRTRPCGSQPHQVRSPLQAGVLSLMFPSPKKLSPTTAGAPQTRREGGRDEAGSRAQQPRDRAGGAGSPEAPRSPRLPGPVHPGAGAELGVSSSACEKGKLERATASAAAAAAGVGGPQGWRGRSRREGRWASASAGPPDVPLHPGHGLEDRGSRAGGFPGPLLALALPGQWLHSLKPA